MENEASELDFEVLDFMFWILCLSLVSPALRSTVGGENRKIFFHLPTSMKHLLEQMGSSSNGQWILSTQSYVSLCCLFFRKEFPNCHSRARNPYPHTKMQKRIVGRYNGNRSLNISIPISSGHPNSCGLLLSAEQLMQSRHGSY